MRNRGFQARRASSVGIGCNLPGSAAALSWEYSRFPPKTPIFGPENLGYAFSKFSVREFASGGLVSSIPPWNSLQINLYRMSYFTDLENYFQWTTFLFALLTSPYPFASAEFHQAQRHMSAYCVIIAWAQLTLCIGRSPGLGMYISILHKMFFVFMRFLFIYIWVILGSSLALFILFVGVSHSDTLILFSEGSGQLVSFAVF